jgi:hypothetical protein
MAWTGGHSKFCKQYCACLQTKQEDVSAENKIAELKNMELLELNDQGLKFPEKYLDSSDEPKERDKGFSLSEREHIAMKLKEFENRGKFDEDEEDDKSVPPESVSDSTFLQFQNRTNRAPDQVLRYMHGNVGCFPPMQEPLWFSASGKPELNDIPVCHSCGAKRVAEFQILPQILYALKVPADSNFDFGTVVIFSCSQSCDRMNQQQSEKSEKSCQYMEEFCWVQHQPLLQKN